jgi:molybdenum cofactor cytidylyltransferase
VPTGEAEGAVLAHTLRAGERVFKKGRLLGAADLAALEAAGHTSLVCARLETGDVGEDAAALAVARAVAGRNVTVGEPTTGRANLFAETAGLLAVAAGGIDRLNAVDEAITVATLAPGAPVVAGEMVGTVKIIPFAVGGEVLEGVLAIARAGSVLRVTPWRPQRAGLVLTRFPSTADALLDRAARSQSERMRRLGGELGREMRVAHETGAVVAALEQLLAEGLAPIFLLGASAIVDRRDVIPSAVEKVGGTIDRLGMPVDPGNLLLLAHKGATPILGVPGCARSLNRSGFDWVLERLAAGVGVDAESLAQMGSGGLLLEMPTRPQPRLGGEPASDD